MVVIVSTTDMSKLVNFAKMHKKLLIVATILLILLLSSQRSGNGIKPVQIDKATSREVIKNISATGETSTKNDFSVRAPVGAKIQQIMFESGSQVKKGDVIIILDSASLKSSAETAYATYLIAKAAVDSYDEQVESAERSVVDKKLVRDDAWREYMADNGENNKQTYKNAEATYKSAISTLQTLLDKKQALIETQNSSYSSYLVSRDNLNNSQIKAPKDGLLALEELTPGDLLTTGDKLFSLVNENGMEFIGEVDENDIDSVQINNSAKVSIDGYPNDTFEGMITRIDVQTRITDTGSTVVEVGINLNLKGKRPILGLSGSADIEVGRESEKLSVPYDSILFDNDKSYVFLIVGNKVKKQEVKIGFEGNDFVVVLNGVNEDDMVVVGKETEELQDGSKVSYFKSE